MNTNKTSVFKKFPRTFWIANTVELFERWAWYGLFMVLALYLTGSKETGALGFTHEQKGLMMGTVTAFLYFMPIITGAFADKFGYKKVLLLAFFVYSTGYLMMGLFTSYPAVFLAFFYVGLGAALFKPVISATIAKTTTSETSSIGFGIFYMMVNIGAFVGPVFASKLRGDSWMNVFIMSSVIIAVNFVLVLIFYKEPAREQNKEPLAATIKSAFSNIFQVLKDFKFLLFLLLIIGFWTMYNQLFYSLPNFIDQWMDTSVIYRKLATISPSLAKNIGTDEGTIAPEMLTNIDALYIVIFQVGVSAFVMRFKPLSAMTGGILVSAIGIGLMFITQNPMYLFISILIFGLGEMASSPKITEYIGRIAPADKKALYMGMSYIPLAGGNFFAGLLAGNVYGTMSDKISLLQKEVQHRNLDIPKISDTFTQTEYVNKAAELMGMTQQQLTQYLWDTYHPQNIWIVFTGIGLATVLGLFLYDKFLLKSKKETTTT